jgi:organic hydroperoxide reductase OsmC/OhrA
MGRDDRGKVAIVSVILRPAVTFSGKTLPDAAAIADLHHRSHEHCYIANSLRAEVTVEPR